MKNKLNRLVGISSTLPAKSGIALVLALGIGQAAFASGGGIVTDAAESLTGVAKARIETYSPYAERDFPDRPLWGDTHLHTAVSFDAGAFGVRLLPPDAYRFAKGQEVVASSG